MSVGSLDMPKVKGGIKSYYEYLKYLYQNIPNRDVIDQFAQGYHEYVFLV